MTILKLEEYKSRSSLERQGVVRLMWLRFRKHSHTKRCEEKYLYAMMYLSKEVLP